MKIRTVSELIDRIDSDLAWRKKELSKLLNDVNRAINKGEGTAIRAGVVLLYAHWEGFIKNAGNFYINFISGLKLKYEELNFCFVALTLKNRIEVFEETNKSSRHGEFISYIFNNMGDKANVPTNVVNTQSNLNSIVLKEILISIGIDYSPYSTKANLIDEKLLNYRNNIAHGQDLLVDKIDYNKLHIEIMAMINMINNDIQNAAVMQLYRRQV